MTIEIKDQQGRTYERFTASLLLVAGIAYLALWVISIFSETSSFVHFDNDKISLNRSDLLAHLRTLIIVVLSIGGSVLLFRRQRAGWLMSTVVLILFLVICSGGMYQAVKLNEAPLIAAAGFAWFILFLSLLFLMVAATRRKFRIGSSILLTTLLLSACLGLFYFFVQ